MKYTAAKDPFRGNHESPCYVEQRGNRRGVFAAREVPSDRVILRLRGVLRPHPSPQSLQLSVNWHLHDSGPIVDAIHHSCDANAAVGWDDFTLKSITRIEPGQEVTLNYCATEDVLCQPFFCDCGNVNCYHYVDGYRYLSLNRKRAIVDTTSRHLIEAYGFGGSDLDTGYDNKTLESMSPKPVHYLYIADAIEFVGLGKDAISKNDIRKAKKWYKMALQAFKNANSISGGKWKTEQDRVKAEYAAIVLSRCSVA